MDNLTVTRTKCIVDVFINGTVNDQNTYSYVREKEWINSAQDFNDALISCSVAKQLGTPASTFELEVAANKNWSYIVLAGDWVTIRIDPSNSASVTSVSGNLNMTSQLVSKNFSTFQGAQLIEVGQIDKVTKTKHMTNNGIMRTIFHISGRGFGKILEDTKIYYNQLLKNEPLELEHKNLDIIKLKGSPTEWINGILDIFLGKLKSETLNGDIPIFNIEIPNRLASFFNTQSTRFLDLIKPDIRPTEGFALARNVLNSGEMTIWELLQSCMNAPWNELIVDIIDGKPTILFRPLPLKESLNEVYHYLTGTYIPSAYSLPIDVSLYQTNKFSNKNIYSQYKVSKSMNDVMITRHDKFDFNFTDWAHQITNNLIVLDSKYIVQESLFFTIENMYNYIYIWPTNFQAQDSIYIHFAKEEAPLINSALIQIYGLRKLELNSDYTSDPVSKSTNFLETLKTLQNQIAPYYMIQHRLHQGSIVLANAPVHPFYLGNYVKLLWNPNDTSKDKAWYDGQENVSGTYQEENPWSAKSSTEQNNAGEGIDRFYRIDGVQYNWEFGNPLMVTLAVSHGIGRLQTNNKFVFLDDHMQKVYPSSFWKR